MSFSAFRLKFYFEPPSSPENGYVMSIIHNLTEDKVYSAAGANFPAIPEVKQDDQPAPAHPAREHVVDPQPTVGNACTHAHHIHAFTKLYKATVNITERLDNKIPNPSAQSELKFNIFRALQYFFSQKFRKPGNDGNDQYAFLDRLEVFYIEHFEDAPNVENGAADDRENYDRYLFLTPRGLSGTWSAEPRPHAQFFNQIMNGATELFQKSLRYTGRFYFSKPTKHDIDKSLFGYLVKTISAVFAVLAATKALSGLVGASQSVAHKFHSTAPGGITYPSAIIGSVPPVVFYYGSNKTILWKWFNYFLNRNDSAQKHTATLTALQDQAAGIYPSSETDSSCYSFKNWAPLMLGVFYTLANVFMVAKHVPELIASNTAIKFIALGGLAGTNLFVGVDKSWTVVEMIADLMDGFNPVKEHKEMTQRHAEAFLSLFSGDITDQVTKIKTILNDPGHHYFYQRIVRLYGEIASQENSDDAQTGASARLVAAPSSHQLGFSLDTLFSKDPGNLCLSICFGLPTALTVLLAIGAVSGNIGGLLNLPGFDDIPSSDGLLYGAAIALCFVMITSAWSMNTEVALGWRTTAYTYFSNTFPVSKLKISNNIPDMSPKDKEWGSTVAALGWTTAAALANAYFAYYAFKLSSIVCVIFALDTLVYVAATKYNKTRGFVKDIKSLCKSAAEKEREKNKNKYKDKESVQFLKSEITIMQKIIARTALKYNSWIKGTGFKRQESDEINIKALTDAINTVLNNLSQRSDEGGAAARAAEVVVEVGAAGPADGDGRVVREAAQYEQKDTSEIEHPLVEYVKSYEHSEEEWKKDTGLTRNSYPLERVHYFLSQVFDLAFGHISTLEALVQSTQDSTAAALVARQGLWRAMCTTMAGQVKNTAKTSVTMYNGFQNIPDNFNPSDLDNWPQSQ